MRPLFDLFVALIVIVSVVACATAQDDVASPSDHPFGPGWSTDVSIRSIDLGELISGGLPKDGIPAIDDP